VLGQRVIDCGGAVNGVHFKSLKKCFIAEEYRSELCYFAPKLFHNKLTIASVAMRLLHERLLSEDYKPTAACGPYLCWKNRSEISERAILIKLSLQVS
jgi:hypothetical protein